MSVSQAYVKIKDQQIITVFSRTLLRKILNLTQITSMVGYRHTIIDVIESPGNYLYTCNYFSCHFVYIISCHIMRHLIISIKCDQEVFSHCKLFFSAATEHHNSIYNSRIVGISSRCFASTFIPHLFYFCDCFIHST